MLMRYWRALESMRRPGAYLMKQHAPCGGPPAWFVVPGGEVSEDTARRIIDDGGVVASQDGAWPGLDQTWKMTNAE